MSAVQAHEWLLTNRLGGYAMGTGAGINTRRYHGLLIAAASPPVQRVVALHSMVEEIEIGGERIALWSQMFQGDDGDVQHADGASRLIDHVHEPNVRTTWRWRVAKEGAVTVSRRLTLTPGMNRATIMYIVEGAAQPVKLYVRPLVPLRGFHELMREGAGDAPRGRVVGSDLVAERGAYVLTLQAADADTIEDEPQWWRGLVYQEDRERGQDFTEDVWSPGAMVFELGGDGRDAIEVFAEFTTSRQHHADDPASFDDPDVRSRPRWNAPADDRLAIAADQFIVKRGRSGRAGTSILAGYPWFADWGRDAMIALPGLLLVDDRSDEAIDVLLAFASAMNGGLIPNRFDDEQGDAAHYNTVDASLWFVHAAWQTLSAASHQGGSRRVSDARVTLINACREVIRAYRQGTMHSIGLCADGLITAGNPTTQLTWMDAKRGETVFTPRHGKAVEINALWHNALHCLAAMIKDEHGNEAAELYELAGRCAIAMQMQFWWAERGCLHDVLVPGVDDDDQFDYRPDGHLRPNQIFAVSLPFSPLTGAMQQGVVDVVGEQLLTPYGLRTLSRNDAAYSGRYQGDMMARDRAYHNGTVWPWLIGPYCEARLRVAGFSDAAKQEVHSILQPLIDELDRGCTGQLAEIYDGDEPHHAHGCPAQAWSVAEVRRVLSIIDG